MEFYDEDEDDDDDELEEELGEEEEGEEVIPSYILCQMTVFTPQLVY